MHDGLIGILAWETVAQFFMMIANAIFAFKYWTMSLVVEFTIKRVDFSKYEKKL